jgi:hypothetical protein
LYGNDDAYDEGLLSDEPKVHRVRAIAEMVQHNTVLYTIMLSGDEQDDQIYDEEISPYLETNRYRPRLLAIKKADIQIRRALLGVALQTKSVSPIPASFGCSCRGIRMLWFKRMKIVSKS